MVRSRRMRGVAVFIMIRSSSWRSADPECGGCMGEPKGPIVWVVEDDPSAQRFIGANLKAHGFVPVPFMSAEKAYAALSYRDRPVVIILDMLLPGMSGVDLIRLLKQNK